MCLHLKRQNRCHRDDERHEGEDAPYHFKLARAQVNKNLSSPMEDTPRARGDKRVLRFTQGGLARAKYFIIMQHKYEMVISLVTEEYIAEFGDLWSLMYYVFAKEMIDSFGNEGEEALRRAIRNYGKTRGLRLKKRHEEQGLPINMRTLFTHYDLPGHPDTQKNRAVFEDDKLISFTYVCPYERIWRAQGGEGIGLLYCEEFHHAMWQAYRPDLKVEIPEILTKDDSHCKFMVTQPKEK